MTSDELRTRLSKTEPAALVEFLVRVADEDSALRARVETLAQRSNPSALAVSLEGRLKRLRAGRSFIEYRESGPFARELEAWLGDIEGNLLAADPQTAWKLLDRFIRSDERILGRADDSNGLIGDAFRRACVLWHRAAAALPADPVWVERVHDLHADNGYGVRDALLDEAAIRLSEHELRRLARRYEQEAESAPRNDTSYQALAASAAMGQIACALGDAALYERSVQILSPQPNRLQAAKIAEQYLRFGPVERAVEWLTQIDGEDAEPSGHERLDLLAQAYEKLGDQTALLAVRRRIADGSLSFELFTEYAALLPPAERAAAHQEAAYRAEQSDSVAAAAAFLLDLGEEARATALVLRRRERLGSSFYEDILALARRLEKLGHSLPAVACYRALIDQILDAGRSPAYRHAKRYADRLAELDGRVSSYGDLLAHAPHLAELRRRHARKVGFWGLFEKEKPSVREA